MEKQPLHIWPLLFHCWKQWRILYKACRDLHKGSSLPGIHMFSPQTLSGAQEDHPPSHMETKWFLNLLLSRVEFAKISLPKVMLTTSWHHWITCFSNPLLAYLPLKSDTERKNSPAFLRGSSEIGGGGQRSTLTVLGGGGGPPVCTGLHQPQAVLWGKAVSPDIIYNKILL